MAHFAQLDENNIVLQVIVVDNNNLLDENGQESELKGIAFCENLLGGQWVQTSYNRKFRKNYAGIGFTYDVTRDAFIPVKPYNSWVLNEDICQWQAPVPRPTDGLHYLWDENLGIWVAEGTCYYCEVIEGQYVSWTSVDKVTHTNLVIVSGKYNICSISDVIILDENNVVIGTGIRCNARCFNNCTSLTCDPCMC